MRQAVFLYSPELWSRGHGPQHPLKPERLKRTFDLLSEYGAFRAGNVSLIEPARQLKTSWLSSTPATTSRQ